MSTSDLLLTLLAAIILLWAGLGIWRRSGCELMQRIEESCRRHYLSHTGESGEAPPRVRWDFEQDTLVLIPPEEGEVIHGSDGFRAMVVKAPEQRFHTSAFGIILARIPGLWFHGAFALGSLLLAFLALRGRAG